MVHALSPIVNTFRDPAYRAYAALASEAHRDGELPVDVVVRVGPVGEDRLFEDLRGEGGEDAEQGALVQSEDRRDRLERAAESSCAATQLAVFRMQADRRKVNGDELAERREEAKKEEEKNEKQRQLVIAYRKAGDRIRAEVMRLIEVKRTQAEKDSRKGKGTKIRRWETDLSTGALELVKIDVLLNRARDAGVDEVELQLALQACGPHGW